MKKKWVVGLAALGLVATPSLAFAAIPDSDDNEFHVCIQTNRSVNSQYTMYVIDPIYQTNFNGGCNTGYTHHVLNQQGPKGDQGDTGPQGPAGEGVSGIETKTKMVVGGSYVNEVLECGEGKFALSGGFRIAPIRQDENGKYLPDGAVASTSSQVKVLSNGPSETPPLSSDQGVMSEGYRSQGWHINLNNTPGFMGVWMYVTCAPDVE